MSEHDESSRKRQNLPSNFDHLSNLPDSIISHILSFLPTKNAVATSVLSSRYESLWKNITKLHFSDLHYSRDEFYFRGASRRNIRFSHFVNRVLFLLESKNIDRFVLHMQVYDRQYDIRNWIEIALSKNVKVLTIFIHHGDVTDKDELYLPTSLYTSQNLEGIYLFGVMSLNVPKFVYLPKLEELCLGRVGYGSSGGARRLISGCPALRSLAVDRDVYDDVIEFNISSQSLRDLSFRFWKESKMVPHATPYPGECDFRLELDAPSLSSLKLEDDFSKDFWFTNLISLDKADISLSNTCVSCGTPSKRMGYINNVVKLLRSTSNVKHLSLSGKVFEELGHEGFSQSYSRLMSLDVSWYSWSSLLHFLHWSKELEEVCFVMEPCLRSNEWSKPGNVPVSLTMSLKTMKIGVIEGGATELAALAYFLANAQVLRKAKVVISSFLDDESKSGLIEEISELCLGSKECEIIFENEDEVECEEEDEDKDSEEEEDAEEDDVEGEDASEDEGEDESEEEEGEDESEEEEDESEGEGDDTGED